MKSRNFILTLNNPDVTITELSEICKRNGATTFAGQLERGTQTGTVHAQFFIGFDNPRSLGSIKKWQPRAHIEPAKNAFRSFEYC